MFSLPVEKLSLSVNDLYDRSGPLTVIPHILLNHSYMPLQSDHMTSRMRPIVFPPL